MPTLTAVELQHGLMATRSDLDRLQTLLAHAARLARDSPGDAALGAATAPTALLGAPVAQVEMDAGSVDLF